MTIIASPVQITVTPVGIQGLKGDPGQASRIKFPFAYGDASPDLVASVTGLVVSAAIIITVPFNGIGATLKIGDAVVSDRLLASTQIDPLTVATYEANHPYFYSVQTNVLLSITPGSGATQGAGYVLLEV